MQAEVNEYMSCIIYRRRNILRELLLVITVSIPGRVIRPKPFVGTQATTGRMPPLVTLDTSAGDAKLGRDVANFAPLPARAYRVRRRRRTDCAACAVGAVRRAGDDGCHAVRHGNVDGAR
jgi:hypothetical protein